MKLKKVITIIILCLFSVQFNITSCSSSTDSNEDGSGPADPASINTPTNDYQVVVEVISFGGFGGCSIAAVNVNDEPITNAIILVNNVTFQNTSESFSNFYSDTLNLLTYSPKTNYTLNASHLGSTIASGTSKMPSIPQFTNMDGDIQHSLNTNLNVSWKPIDNATSIELIIEGYSDDESSEFSSGLIDPSLTSFTIPDTFFTIPGEYNVGIIAYNGINPGLDVEDITSEGSYSESYNMVGAAGVFFAASAMEAGGIVNVLNSTVTKSNQISRRNGSFKEIVLRRHQKRFR